MLALACLALCLGQSAAGVPEDSAFDKYVSPLALRSALVKLTPVELLTVTEGLLAGEKALDRPRAGITAKATLKVAIRAAVGRKDAASLVQLEKLAKGAGLTDLALAAGLAKNAARGGGTDPAIMAALDRIDPDDFATFRSFLSQIESARTLGDREALAALETRANGLGQFDSKLRGYLAKTAGAAKESLPADAPADEDVAAIAKLSAAARQVSAEVKVSSPEPKVPKEPKTDDPPMPKAEGFKGTIETIGSAPESLVDDGFEGKFDLAKVGAAYAKGDAASLTDLAFRLAEEERILRRPHKHVPAKTLLQGAFGLAIQNGDQKTVARIEAALKEKGGTVPLDAAEKETMLAGVETSKQLALASRKGTPPLTVALDTVSEESFIVFRYFLDRVKAAKATRDGATLEGLAGGLDFAVELDSAQREYLNRQITEARETFGGDPPPGTDLLRQLAAASRAPGFGLSAAILRFANQQVGKKVGDGSSVALLTAALKSAGAVGVRPRPVPANEVKPGDVVTFKAAKFSEGKSAVTYADHTGIISRAEGKEKVRWMLIQGAGGKAVVALVPFNPANLKSGTIEYTRYEAKMVR